MASKKKIIKKIPPIVSETPINIPEMTNEQPVMTEQDMKDDLERGFEDVKTKNNALESQKISVTNQMRQLKLEILKELFGFLQKNGVDPNDLASINQFLQKLEQQDPDFVALFELVLNGLSPEGQTTPNIGAENAPVSEMAGNMPENGNPVTSGVSVPPTPPDASSSTASLPPAFMQRYNDLKQRGII